MNIGTMRAGACASALAGAMALAGCASFSQDGGFDAVARTARERVGQEVRWTRTAQQKAQADRDTAQLLARALCADDAVRIALLNNGSLQASFQELGISEADLVRSGRPPQPRFTLRRSSAQGLADIEETVSVSVLALITAPSVHEIEKRRFAAVQAQLAAGVIELAARTRTAYYSAIAARDTARYRLEVEQAAETGAELARRMRAAGNWTRLDEAREQGFHLEAALELERARLAEQLARENLVETLGVSLEGAGLRLAERLPDLPSAIDPLPDLEPAALERRVDLQLMRARIDVLARELHLTRATRFLDVLDAGPTRVQQGPGSAPIETGYEVSLEVPIFDSGAPRLRKAEARYAQAVASFGQAALEARSQLRQAYARYRSAYEIARRERDELLPLRQSMADEELRRYDAGQISVFDLLADSRSRIATESDYIQSLRDFWIARATLDAAIAGAAAPLPRVLP
ncbi:MAG TPA: TolC family protein [Steroidobacteraceae bacterium]|nr:TolC family protein [Steroidobacteraceae bacterium]